MTAKSKIDRGQLTCGASLLAGLALMLHAALAHAWVELVQPRYLCEANPNRSWMEGDNGFTQYPLIVSGNVGPRGAGSVWLGAWTLPNTPHTLWVARQGTPPGQGGVEVRAIGLYDSKEIDNPKAQIELPGVLAQGDIRLEFRRGTEVLQTLAIDYGPSKVSQIVPLAKLSSVEQTGGGRGLLRYDFRVQFTGCVPQGFGVQMQWKSDAVTAYRVVNHAGRELKSGSLILSITSEELLRRPPGMENDLHAFPAKLSITARSGEHFEWPLGMLEFTANATPNRIDLGRKEQQLFQIEVKYRGGKGVSNVWLVREKGQPIEKGQPSQIPLKWQHREGRYAAAGAMEKTLQVEVPRQAALMAIARTPRDIWLGVEDNYDNIVYLRLPVVNWDRKEEQAAREMYAYLKSPQAPGVPSLGAPGAQLAPRPPGASNNRAQPGLNQLPATPPPSIGNPRIVTQNVPGTGERAMALNPPAAPKPADTRVSIGPEVSPSTTSPRHQPITATSPDATEPSTRQQVAMPNVPARTGGAARVDTNVRAGPSQLASLGKMEVNKSRAGGDYGPPQAAATAQACQSLCMGQVQCKAWTWVDPQKVQGPEGGKCWLKNVVPAASDSPGRISGVR